MLVGPIVGPEFGCGVFWGTLASTDGDVLFENDGATVKGADEPEGGGRITLVILEINPVESVVWKTLVIPIGEPEFC